MNNEKDLTIINKIRLDFLNLQLKHGKTDN